MRFIEFLLEAQFGFGQHKGKDISQVPTHYLQWMLDQMKSGKSATFKIGDAITVQQKIKLVQDELSHRTGGSSQTQQTVSPQQRQQHEWISAVAKVDDPDNKIRKDQKVALKDNKDGTWTFATLYKGHIQHYGILPKDELASRFQREMDTSGMAVRGERASSLAKSTIDKAEKKFTPTHELQNIDAKFKEMVENPDQNHMFISALAGTGKSTSLKYLAEKYGRPGQKWLYLVFGSKNQQEASEKFPKFVTVKTTNSFAGDVLNANRVKPTERIKQYTQKGSKISEIIDGDQYKKMVSSLNVVDFNNRIVPYNLKKYFRSIWTEFNKEVEKLTGLTKAFNINPEKSEDLKQEINDVAKQYDINSDLERVKEVIQKSPNSDYLNREISGIMGIPNFLAEDFTDRIIDATSWLLDKSKPHGIEQEFLQTHEKPPKSNYWKKLDEPVKRNLKGLRDFDDDLWYAAMHADELDWTRPTRYQFVLVDEVQDFNKAQRKILEALMKTGAKVVAVGDRRQALFRFRGSDSASFDEIGNMLEKASANKEGVRQTLTQNWRSKPEVIQHANETSIVNDLVAGIQHDPNDPGVVTERKFKFKEVLGKLSDEMQRLGEPKKETAFLARTNEPLASAAMELLKHKIPFMIYGKNLSTDILDVINRVQKWQEYRISDDSPIDDLSRDLQDFVNEKSEKWSGQQKKQGELADLLEANKAIVASVDVIKKEAEEEEKETPTVGEFKNWLYKRLGAIPDYLSPKEKADLKARIEKENPVILTTTHRSKGLEFDRVYELTPSLYPHPKSKLPADLEQEEHGRYVGKTRARHEYHELNDTEEE